MVQATCGLIDQLFSSRDRYKTDHKLRVLGAIDLGNTSVVKIQDTSFIYLFIYFFATGTGMQTLEKQAFVVRLFFALYFVSEPSAHATHFRLN